MQELTDTFCISQARYLTANKMLKLENAEQKKHVESLKCIRDKAMSIMHKAIDEETLRLCQNVRDAILTDDIPEQELLTFLRQ